MANDFLSGVQVGAQIGNMRVAQQERMIELRSQAALNAIRERELAAQADLIAQHTAQLQMQNARQAQALQTIAGVNQRYQIGSDMIDSDDEKTPEEREALKGALRQRLTGELPLRDPLAAQMVGQAQTWLEKPEAAKATSEAAVIRAKNSGAGRPTTPHQQFLEDLALRQEARRQGTETRLLSKEQRIAAFAPIREQIKQINGQIRALQGQHDKLMPQPGEVEDASDPDVHDKRMLRMSLSAQLAGLREQAVNLTRQASAQGALLPSSQSQETPDETGEESAGDNTMPDIVAPAPSSGVNRFKYVPGQGFVPK